ncbi:MAG: winged helix-turn-helix domain-containing protein [Cellvibrionaceae bacterium]|nr:winged helix-turn-helix domain-containing protein [Cellvibrionaceae bacterium]
MNIKQGWKLLSNHAHVLLCLAKDPNMRLRDIADQVGITQRAIQRIITELEQASLLSHQREGRRNFYQIHPEQTLQHPLEQNYTVGHLLDAVANSDSVCFTRPTPDKGKIDLAFSKGAGMRAK